MSQRTWPAAAASKHPRVLVVARRTPSSLLSALLRRLAAAEAGYDELVRRAAEEGEGGAEEGGGPADGVEPPALVWHPVGGGALALWHRPRVSDVRRFAALGATHLVTLLGVGEKPAALGAAAAGAGVAWTWVDLPGASREKLRDPGARAALVVAWASTAAALAAGARVVVHCAAGIHRTGVFAYGCLRLCGRLDAARATEALRPMRRLTAEGVLAWRLEIAETLVGPLVAAAERGTPGD